MINKDIKIIDYKKDYASQYDALDYSYWGNSEEAGPSSEIDDKAIVKLALKDDRVVGLLHFKIIGDLIDAYHVLVDKQFYHQGIATALMEEGLKEVSMRFIPLLLMLWNMMAKLTQKSY